LPSHSSVPDEHAYLSCGSTDVEVFHQEAGVPVNSCLLLASEAEARAFPRGAIRLGFCHACGFIANTAFDRALAEYSTRYEETQGFSPRFQRFADDLDHRLVDPFDLHDKDILEIGCGKASSCCASASWATTAASGSTPAWCSTGCAARPPTGSASSPTCTASSTPTCRPTW
jgi:hypothetical protein